MKKSVLLFGAIVISVFITASAMVFTACENDVQPELKKYLIITFDKNNGDAGSTEANPKTITIYYPDETLVHAGKSLPDDPWRASYVFSGWNRDPSGEGADFDEEAIAPEIVNTTNLSYQDFTVYAQWKPGSVLVTKEGGAANTAFPNLEKALDFISETGSYTVKIVDDQTIASHPFSVTGVSITIEAAPGTNAAITRSGTGDLFTINTGVTLTLGSGITLNGESRAGRGVNVNGGTFIMEGGTITGFTGFTGTNGGGVCLTDGAFTMKGGIISGNSATYGGGVYVFSSKTFAMKGGTIGGVAPNGNTASMGGGVYNSGTFILEDGTITGNTANSASIGGGGVYNSGTFTMEGGTISKNSAVNGGGVYNPGDFTMEDGTITENDASGNGGGVEVSSGYPSGTFTMEGGTISKNSAANGGGVSNKANFTMEDGIISENEAENGGGVYIAIDYGVVYGDFTMEGGTISGNSASNGGNGGGIYVSEFGDFTMEGGTIYGYDAAPAANKNEAEGLGQAIYVDPSLMRNETITIGPEDEPLVSRDDEDERWEEIAP